MPIFGHQSSVTLLGEELSVRVGLTQTGSRPEPRLLNTAPGYSVGISICLSV